MYLMMLIQLKMEFLWINLGFEYDKQADWAILANL
jgi:hypothetical protein